jgi:hypothetical protein
LLQFRTTLLMLYKVWCCIKKFIPIVCNSKRDDSVLVLTALLSAAKSDKLGVHSRANL